jgi:hypothetical protein
MTEQRFKVRILSGDPMRIEGELNGLLDDYAPAVWNFTAVDNEVIVTVVLVDKREISRAQMMAAVSMQGLPPGGRIGQ